MPYKPGNFYRLDDIHVDVRQPGTVEGIAAQIPFLPFRRNGKNAGWKKPPNEGPAGHGNIVAERRCVGNVPVEAVGIEIALRVGGGGVDSKRLPALQNGRGGEPPSAKQ